MQRSADQHTLRLRLYGGAELVDIDRPQQWTFNSIRACGVLLTAVFGIKKDRQMVNVTQSASLQVNIRQSLITELYAGYFAGYQKPSWDAVAIWPERGNIPGSSIGRNPG